jgi:hypothetical protein
MSYNGNSVTLPIVYVPLNIDNTNRGVYEVQHLILMLNNTINSLYTALNAIAHLPTTDMPYFTYNETTTLISYVANKTYFASNLTTPIVLSIGETTFKFLQGLPIYSHNTYYDILVRDTNNNNLPSSDYYTMTQQAQSFDNYSDFFSIVFTTSLPIQNEYYGTSSVIPIIQDYCPTDLDIKTFHNEIVYNAVFPYRQVSMSSNSPITNITINCMTSSTSGITNGMTLPPNSAANIKLMFTEHAHNKYA